MPTSRKTTKAALAAAAAMPSIPKELIDQIVTGPMSAEAVNAASMAFKKALIEPRPGRRAFASPGLPARRDQARGRGQPPQWRQRQDRTHCGRPASHRDATRSGGLVRALTHSLARSALRIRPANPPPHRARSVESRVVAGFPAVRQ
jgi:hypothetical protein